ncbi:MAG TPA: hypothetical protein ENN97_04535 [Phycisphaerales bacterium]|nr:hypothetical protein [Phycisphaerales bacterium]
MKRQVMILLVGLVGLSAAGVAAFPTPAMVQKPTEWTLTVQFEHPRQMMLRVPGRQTPERFWYLILSLTNDSDHSDVPFVPTCELVTDNFEIIPAGFGIPKGVFETIKLRHQGSYPFLESLDFRDNRIRRGADNARDFVVIWKDFNLKASEVSFFIAGLSNETTAILHPTRTDEEGSPVKVFLQKTLQLRYNVGADAARRDRATLELIEQEWVMR